MEHVDELGTEDGIRGCETTARKDTQLQHLCNGAVFCDSYIGGEGDEQDVKLNRKEQISWFHTNTLEILRMY